MANLSSIARKGAMALSGFFLLVFIAQHFSINFLSVLSPDMFNSVSFFMGTNPIVQVALQPVLMFGFIFHIVMGMYLEYQNRQARPVSYASGSASEGASFFSKNMIYTGVMVMLFLGLHLYDFWWHEMTVKYFDPSPGVWEDATRFYPELVAMFSNPIRVLIYILAFISLGLHLAHGFQSAFQSVGANHPKYTQIIKKTGMVFSLVIPVGFTFIALFHYINSL